MSSRRLVASSSRRGRGTGLAEERKASPVTAPGRLRPPWCYVWLRDQVWRVCISPRVWWCAEFLLLAPAIRTNDCRGAGGPPVPPRPLWRPLLKRRMYSPSFCPPRVVPVCALRGKKRKGCGRGALAALVRLRGSPPRAAAAAALAFFPRPATPSGAALGRPAAGRRVVCRLFGAWWVAPCLLLLLLRFLRFVRSWLPLLRRGCVACLRRVPGFAAVRCLSGCPCLLLFSGRPRCLSCSLLLGRGLVSSRLLSPVSLLLLPPAPPGLSSSGSWCWLPRCSSALCGGWSCSGECGGAGAGGAGGVRRGC